MGGAGRSGAVGKRNDILMKNEKKIVIFKVLKLATEDVIFLCHIGY